ncbi:MAG TPA: hypothetical protein DE117_00170 [Fervidobacterium sp.]|nr:hypothetical protein [Fervidobacterium sp.]
MSSMNLGEGNNSIDVVEKFLRMLIVRNELSLARNIIEALGSNYSHILFELEIKAGNLKRAAEIYKLLPEEKQQIYLHVVENIEDDADKVAKSLEKIIKEFQTENYPIVIAEAQKLKREFPQVIEVVAVEALTAIRKGDKKKIKSLSEILRQLDKTHPVLSQVKTIRSNVNTILPVFIITIFALVLINLIISIFSLNTSPALELGNIETSIKDMIDKTQEYNAQLSSQISALSDAISMIKTSLDYLDQKVSQAIATGDRENSETYSDKLVQGMEDQMKLIEEKLSKIEKSISNISSSSSSKSISGSVSGNTPNVDLTPITKELAILRSKMDALSSKMQVIADSYKSGGVTAKDSSQSKDLLVTYNVIDSSELKDMDSKITQQTEAIVRLRERIDALSQSLESIKQNAGSNSNQLQYQTPMPVVSQSIDEKAIYTRLDALTNTISLLSKEVTKLKEAFNDISTTTKSNDAPTPTAENKSNTVVVQQIDQNAINTIKSLEEEIAGLKRALSELKEENNQSDKNISSKIDSSSKVVSSLATEIASIKESITKLSNQSQATSSEVSKLSSAVSSLQKSLEALSKDVSSVVKQLDEIKKDVDTLKSSAANTINTNSSSSAMQNTSQSTSSKTSNTQDSSESVDVQKIIKETRDLRELFLNGLRFYSNEQYENAIAIFSYLEVQLEGIEVYFKEDVHYYLIKSYLSLNDVTKATKKYEDYKKKYPSGQYLNELKIYFK